MVAEHGRRGGRGGPSSRGLATWPRGGPLARRRALRRDGRYPGREAGPGHASRFRIRHRRRSADGSRGQGDGDPACAYRARNAGSSRRTMSAGSPTAGDAAERPSRAAGGRATRTSMWRSSTRRLRLLAELGYQNMSIAATAAAAGVGRPAVYRRYRSKADLAVAAILRISAGPGPVLPSDPRQALRVLLTMASGALATPGAMAVLGSLLAEQRHDPELLAALRARIFDPRRATIHRIVKEGVMGARSPAMRTGKRSTACSSGPCWLGPSLASLWTRRGSPGLSIRPGAASPHRSHGPRRDEHTGACDGRSRKRWHTPCP